jgi:hypothetical protein
MPLCYDYLPDIFQGRISMTGKHAYRLSAIFPALLLFSLLLASCNLPAAAPTATPTVPPTDTPLPPIPTATVELPSPTTEPTATATQSVTSVDFTTGTTAAVEEGTLTAGQDQAYSVNAMQGQPMILILESPQSGLYLGVTEPNGTILLDPAKKWNTWQWLLPKTENYTIKVYSDAATANYTLTIKVAPVVQFSSGATSATLNGMTVNGYVFSYALYCTAGQTMTASLNTPATTATLDIFGLATGMLLSDSADKTSWTGVLPSTEDYVVEVIPKNGQVVNYTLTVSCQ